MLASPFEQAANPDYQSEEAWAIEHAEAIARIAAERLGYNLEVDVPDREEAIDRASMLITLLRCMAKGEHFIDLNLGCDIVDADRDLAERLLTWVGEKHCEVLANITH